MLCYYCSTAKFVSNNTCNEQQLCVYPPMHNNHAYLILTMHDIDHNILYCIMGEISVLNNSTILCLGILHTFFWYITVWIIFNHDIYTKYAYIHVIESTYIASLNECFIIYEIESNTSLFTGTALCALHFTVFQHIQHISTHTSH